jgi:hypothetical protein
VLGNGRHLIAATDARATIKSCRKRCFVVRAEATFIRDKPIFSSERMLQKDCYPKGSLKRICGHESQDEMMSDKPPIEK